MAAGDVIECDVASGDTADGDIKRVEVAICDRSLDRYSDVGMGFSLLPEVNTLKPLLAPAFLKFSGSKTKKDHKGTANF